MSNFTLLNIRANPPLMTRCSLPPPEREIKIICCGLFSGRGLAMVSWKNVSPRSKLKVVDMKVVELPVKFGELTKKLYRMSVSLAWEPVGKLIFKTYITDGDVQCTLGMLAFCATVKGWSCQNIASALRRYSSIKVLYVLKRWG